jgi:CelD/BcsL family acetyltransferase involved in cellulose biosynthesis
MDEYYSSLSKNERKNRRKYELRLLSKEHDTSIEVIKDTKRISTEFDRFAEQHTAQWRVEGKPGHFGAWPKALDFNRALVATQGARERVRFIRIVADGNVVANQYVFVFGTRYFWELPSRAVAPQWDRFSLGPTSIVTMLHHAMTEGMTRVEGGLAHYDYKTRLGAKEYQALTYRIVGSSLSAKTKYRLFMVLSTIVDLAYNKIWYRRIAPRLPIRLRFKQSPLWLRLQV